MNNNKEKFGKVAVLMGGTSAEREISLKSGQAVLNALLESGVDAQAVDVGKDIILQLTNGNYDRVFNMLHGRLGEDGVIQGVLEVMNLPYTGSGVMASALGMDKLKTKEIWLANDLPTPNFYIVDRDTPAQNIIESLGLPIIIKPMREGSSIGMSKVKSEQELQPALDMAMKFDDKILAEKWIEGAEYTAAILNDTALPLIRLETPNIFYDYDAKYVSNSTNYHCPCGLDSEKEEELKKLALKAFKAVDGYGWGRVDMMMDVSGLPYLIEVNTLPGMTDHSLVPMAAKQNGITFNSLVLQILESSLCE